MSSAIEPASRPVGRGVGVKGALPWYHGWYMNVRVRPRVKLENTVKEP